METEVVEYFVYFTRAGGPVADKWPRGENPYRQGDVWYESRY